VSRILLIGAGFTRNWGGPLSEKITGSLLGELHDDQVLAAALRRGPFEEAFPGFQGPPVQGEEAGRLNRFQSAVTGLFDRLNRTFLARRFEFNDEMQFSIKKFLARFDAIFSLNQDLLLEIRYMRDFGQEGRWSGVLPPGMEQVPFAGPQPVPFDPTRVTWRPSENMGIGANFQPLYKLHGSSNWTSKAGEPLLIMGNQKSGAIQRFPVLQHYHQQFAFSLRRPATRLMVIGYSFQDEHINSVIEAASRETKLGTYLVDPRGRDVLRDPKMREAMIKMHREIEHIRLIGELRRPLSSVFGGDVFAYGELMRFFQ
jgi:SIR2-like domain